MAKDNPSKNGETNTQPQPQPEAITSTNVIGGLIAAVRIVARGIKIWEKAAELQPLIEEVLRRVVGSFMEAIKNESAEVQVLKAADLIKVLRTMEKVLNRSPALVLRNGVTEEFFEDELEKAVRNALVQGEDLHQKTFETLLDYFDFKNSCGPLGDEDLPDTLA